MLTRTAVEQIMCPFTLEECEGCNEHNILSKEAICPFTLESCLFVVRGATLAVPGNGGMRSKEYPHVRNHRMERQISCPE